MPPHIPKKRKIAGPPTAEPPPKRKTPAKSTKINNVYSAADSLQNGRKKRRVSQKQAMMEIVAMADSPSDTSSSASEEDEDEFEEVSIARDNSVKDDEEEMDWEDAMVEEVPLEVAPEHRASNFAGASGNLELTLSKPEVIPSYVSKNNSGKKGPTKIERQIRTDTHCLHVLALMWHNTIRNSWINDKEVQKILVDALTEGITKEIQRWRTASGLDAESMPKESPMRKGKKTKAKGKGKKADDKGRDWPERAKRQQIGVPDMSAGDPLIRLLQHLASYWKQRFRVSAPGMRKRGYMSVIENQKELEDWKKEGKTDSARFGECIANREDFRKAAKSMTGSRDVEAQLFTALLRGIGITTRLVASLQPAGFGWSQIEDGKRKKESPNKAATPKKNGKASKVVLITSDSDLSDAVSIEADSDIDAIVEVTPKKSDKSKIENDLPFPVYWTEALSPITNTYIPVSTKISTKVAAGPESLAAFEPRGAAAERAKQVMCYVMAFSADGTAKDVTVRYLRKHMLPGKTKGFRLPPEKIAIHNKRGKVVRITEVDWFKRVQSFYERPSLKRTVADDIEDQGDLVPARPQKVAKEGGMPDTLQGFKSSTEFVLERHFRREEAVLPTAKAVKQFTVGKGDKAKAEPVYKRKDVVSCKTTESWHKEGRQVRDGQQPLKLVPIRAVTLVRKLEVESQMRSTGEKPLQGLYSKAQTEWIIPPPIQDGKIPKNAYGNIDIYVSSMIPRGAVHIPWGGTVKVCKKLGIDYAEAVTGFDFGHNMAVPVISGVVVAEENEQLVVELWEEEEEKKRLREDEKREKKLLGLWRKFALGLRIMDRVSVEYGGGEVPDDVNPFTKKKAKPAVGKKEKKDSKRHEEEEEAEDTSHNFAEVEEFGGGFLPEGMELHEDKPKPNGTLEMGLEIEGEEGADGPKRKASKKQMPMSLREMHADTESEVEEDDNGIELLEEDQAGGFEVSAEDNDSEDIDDDDDDSGDEEYAAFSTPKGKKDMVASASTRGRASRKAATESPYFKTSRSRR